CWEKRNRHTIAVPNWIPPIARFRKILGIAALPLACAATNPLGATATPPTRVRGGLSQSGRRLIVSLATSKPVALARLARLPPGRGSRFLCLELRRAGRPG